MTISINLKLFAQGRSATTGGGETAPIPTAGSAMLGTRPIKTQQLQTEAKQRFPSAKTDPPVIGLNGAFAVFSMPGLEFKNPGSQRTGDRVAVIRRLALAKTLGLVRRLGLSRRLGLAVSTTGTKPNHAAIQLSKQEDNPASLMAGASEFPIVPLSIPCRIFPCSKRGGM